MYGDLIKKWWEAFFWWLPTSPETGDDKQPSDTRTARESQQAATQEPRPAPATSESAGGQSPEVASARQAASVKAAQDDLSEIKGIGPAIAARLSALGIISFRDLAATDPKDLAEKLDSRPITPARVRAWVEAAKTRAG